MVHGQGQQVPVGGDSDQDSTDQRAGRQVEGQGGVRRGQGTCGGFRLGRVGHVDDRQGERPRRVDHLSRHTVRARHQSGAQHLVAGRDPAQRGLQRRRVQVAVQADGRRQVVLGRAVPQLLQEPEPLLAERQRQRPVPV